jgi:hypothetical protein
LYKVLVTIDQPVRLVVLGIQYLAQSLAIRPEKAARTRDRLTATAHFVATGLGAFWGS